jgi:hypothetical protein
MMTVLKGFAIAGVVAAVLYIIVFHGKTVLLTIPETSGPIWLPS